MLTPAPEIIALLSHFSSVFSTPTFTKVVLLVCGAILAPHTRTVCSLLRMVGHAQDAGYSRYHRVFNRAQWRPHQLSRLLLALLIKVFVPTDAPLQLVVDETLERRWGARVAYKGVFRDPVRSTHKKVVTTPGVRWLCVALLVQLPWCQRAWALPIFTVPMPTRAGSARQGVRHHSTVERTAQLLRLLRRWQPDRALLLSGDGAFAAVPLIQHCQRKHIVVTLITRGRWNARLFDRPGAQPRSKHGPKPKKGARQIGLEARRDDPQTVWQPLTVTWYGGQPQTVEVATGTSLWHRAGLDPVPIRWVLLRDPQGEFETTPLFCSQQELRALQIVEAYVGRWNLEVTFQELRAHLGFETQRHWSPRAVQRVTPALFGLFSLIVLLAHQRHPHDLPTRTTAWYAKAEPTFSDALAAARAILWPLDQLAPSPTDPDHVLFPRAWLDPLRHLTLYGG